MQKQFLLITLGFVAGCVAKEAAEIMVPKALSLDVKKTEFLCTRGPEKNEYADILNKYGMEGWDVSHTISEGGTTRKVCFKRALN